MFAFFTRRLAAMCGVLFCVLTLTFLLLRLSPGGPFTRERKLPAVIEKQLMAKYRLDGPLWQQYLDYLADVARGDLRLSTKYRDRAGVGPAFRPPLRVVSRGGLEFPREFVAAGAGPGGAGHRFDRTAHAHFPS
jgi:hypothetical protein